jgi:hypothetical protein
MNSASNTSVRCVGFVTWAMSNLLCRIWRRIVLLFARRADDC